MSATEAIKVIQYLVRYGYVNRVEICLRRDMPDSDFVFHYDFDEQTEFDKLEQISLPKNTNVGEVNLFTAAPASSTGDSIRMIVAYWY